MAEIDTDLLTTLPPESRTNGTQPVTRLCALDALFAATGTVDIKVTRGGVETVLSIPIQSVDTEMVEALARHAKPKPPTRVELNNGRRVVTENQADPGYQDALIEYNRLTSYIMVFCGIAMDITNEQHQVVWSADNTVHDLSATRAVAKKMGVVDSQLVTFMQAIRDLTTFTEEAQGGN